MSSMIIIKTWRNCELQNLKFLVENMTLCIGIIKLWTLDYVSSITIYRHSSVSKIC